MTEPEASYQNEDRAEPNMPDSDYDELPDVDETTLESPTSVDGGHTRLGNYIPFSSIHGPSINFKAQKRRVFIPGEDIKVQIIDYERNVTSHLLSPNLYTIKLQHGDFTWIIKKRYKHIHHLHQQLQLFRASLNIPFPTRNHRERRTSYKADKGQSCKRALPRFPNKPEALVSYEGIEHRIKQLEEYLQNLLQIGLYRNYYETVLFLESSHLSFVRDLGIKGKEGMVLKRTGSTQPGKAGCNFCGLLNQTVCVRCSYFCSDLCGTWRYRWLFIKDTYLGYIRPKDGLVKCVMLFDTGFEVSSGIYAGGMAQGLQIINHSRQIIIKCWTKRKRKEWLTFLKEISSGPAHFFTQINRYHSFAPERSSLEASWFVDGCSYMSAVADALEKAREEIYIADWWLSPEIYMKRPMINGDHWRLDKILQRKAAEGVKIFVLLYKEIELALGINSYYSKQRLVSSHDNIKVLRHPDHAKAGVFLWAHHEKIVVIDQTYAFLGGIDLCYGRWDDHQHRLTDLGSVSQNLGLFAPLLKARKTSSHPAVDSCGAPRALRQLAVATNTVGIGVLSSSQPTLNSAGDHMAQPPGIAVPELKRGDKILMGPTTPAQQENDPETVKCNTPDTERKNLFERVREKTENAKQRGKQFMSWLNPGSEEEEEIETKDTDAVPLANNAEVEVVTTTEEILKIDQNEKDVETQPNAIINDEEYGDYKPKDENSTKDLTGMAKYWLGKDYTNFIVKDFNNLDQPYQDLVDRKATPRMPWHDVGVMVVGETARDVARHFIQRWNAIKLEKAALNPVYPYLLPKTYENLGNLCFSRIGDIPMHLVNCQVLRSVCSWSAGFLDADTVEESIHEAYIDVIIKAKHYIYIENQFFISLAGQSSSVRNRICETLCDRIYAAYKKQEVFRVYVVMPLLPGFEGELGTPTGTALQAITHWNYASICRGKEALLNKLKELGVQDATDYISFYGLRNHSVLNGELVSELIYVHSKLLIADDCVVICGSANINDRSMIGKRDSEIAVVIQDVDFEAGTMNGQPYQCGRYAGSLRKHLFKEHLGLLESNKVQDLLIDVSDPVCDHFYHNVWMATAASNTQIYEEVFKCIPSDNVRNFQELRSFQEQLALCHTDPLTASRKLDEIHGHLVELPLNFLSNEVLTPNPGTVECMMPTALWT